MLAEGDFTSASVRQTQCSLFVPSELQSVQRTPPMGHKQQLGVKLTNIIYLTNAQKAKTDADRSRLVL